MEHVVECTNLLQYFSQEAAYRILLKQYTHSSAYHYVKIFVLTQGNMREVALSSMILCKLSACLMLETKQVESGQ